MRQCCVVQVLIVGILASGWWIVASVWFLGIPAANLSVKPQLAAVCISMHRAAASGSIC
jgi:hypothetical protein